MKGPTGFRLCVSCRRYFPKETLIRVLRDGDELLTDPGRKAFGRSAYICRNAECVKRALEKGALRKSLRTSVPEDFAKRLRESVREEETV